MTVCEAELAHVIETGNLLGEGIQWHPKSRSVWWTDISDDTLYRFHWPSRELSSRALPESLCSFAFTGDGDTMLAAFAGGFAHYSPADGVLSRLSGPAFDTGKLRFNDGRADRQGRFWSGTMVKSLAKHPEATASLYCVDLDGSPALRETGVVISNGICWSPDSTRFYYADSARGVIYQYAFHAKSGRISDRRVFARTAAGAAPDGANVDAAGFLWSALWGAGRVQRFSPEGEPDFHIALPVSQPTCIAFGGDALDLLFVTTAREGLDPAELARQPQAGHVFVYRLNVRGLPESAYLGDLRR